ncbi:hypothetical protein OF83DRAFT_1089847, partial [Amylostereum chailletii]
RSESTAGGWLRRIPEPLAAPRLCQVILVNTFIPFLSSVSTRLEIRGDSGLKPICNANELISILQVASTSLQVLILQDRFPLLGDNVSRSHGADFSIDLPHLRILKLTGSSTQCAALKRRLAIPLTAYLRLNIYDGHVHNSEDNGNKPFFDAGVFPNIADTFQDFIYRMTWPDLCLTIDEYLSIEDGTAIVVYFQIPVKGTIGNVEDPGRLSLGSSGSRWCTIVEIIIDNWLRREASDANAVLVRLSMSLAFSHLETLCLRCAGREYAGAELHWRIALAPLKALRTLELYLHQQLDTLSWRV